MRRVPPLPSVSAPQSKVVIYDHNIPSKTSEKDTLQSDGNKIVILPIHWMVTRPCIGKQDVLATLLMIANRRREHGVVISSEVRAIAKRRCRTLTWSEDVGSLNLDWINKVKVLLHVVGFLFCGPRGSPGNPVTSLETAELLVSRFFDQSGDDPSDDVVVVKTLGCDDKTCDRVQ